MSIGQKVVSQVNTTWPNLTLDWTANALAGATWYAVYSSTTLGVWPNSWTLETAVPPGVTGGPPWTWTDMLTTPYPRNKFYIVVGFP